MTVGSKRDSDRSEESSGNDKKNSNVLPHRPPFKYIVRGRGALANTHSGNRIFRRLVDYNRPAYRRAGKTEKKRCVISILVSTKRQGFLFVRRCSSSPTGWSELSSEESFTKVSQALRERKRSKCCSEDGAVLPQDPPENETETGFTLNVPDLIGSGLENNGDAHGSSSVVTDDDEESNRESAISKEEGQLQMLFNLPSATASTAKGETKSVHDSSLRNADTENGASEQHDRLQHGTLREDTAASVYISGPSSFEPFSSI